MALDSKIEWCHDTGNLWWGCTEIENNPGCDNCYAHALSNRFNAELWGHDKPRRLIETIFRQFNKMQAKAVKEGIQRRVFVGSMMDIFEKPMPVMHKGKIRDDITTGDLRNMFFNTVVPNCPNLLFLLLTKRPTNIVKYIPESWHKEWPKNVMYGTSISTQKNADEVIPKFLATPGAGNLFLSIEPLLEEVKLKREWLKPAELSTGDLLGTAMPGAYNYINWVIVGGESGVKRRPFNLDWARTLQAQCYLAGVPFFFKQIDKVRDKKDGIPEDLMVRQFPLLAP